MAEQEWPKMRFTSVDAPGLPTLEIEMPPTPEWVLERRAERAAELHNHNSQRGRVHRRNK